MGRRGSQLISFLKDGLVLQKYPNLKFENKAESIFSLSLPRKTKKLDPQTEQILKDWRALKKQPYNYTKAKQAIESALKKTVFLEQMKPQGENFIFRILNNDEIKEKKKVLKELAVVKKEYSNPPSVNSSGYGSGSESPGSISSQNMEGDVLFIPDHDYVLHEEVAYSATSLIEETINVIAPLSVTEIKDEKTETNYIMEQDHDILPQTWDAIQNNALQIGNMEQIWDPIQDNALQIGHMERILDPIENVNPVSVEMGSLISSCLMDYSSGYELQNAFDDFSLDTLSDVAELNQLMEGIGDAVLPSHDGNFEIPKKKDTIFHFRESISMEDGEIWIFEPKVHELSAIESDAGSSKIIMDIEKFQKMKCCVTEICSSKEKIIVLLKHLENF